MSRCWNTKVLEDGNKFFGGDRGLVFDIFGEDGVGIIRDCSRGGSGHWSKSGWIRLTIRRGSPYLHLSVGVQIFKGLKGIVGK
jgi:hypothetical protein